MEEQGTGWADQSAPAPLYVVGLVKPAAEAGRRIGAVCPPWSPGRQAPHRWKNDWGHRALRVAGKSCGADLTMHAKRLTNRSIRICARLGRSTRSRGMTSAERRRFPHTWLGPAKPTKGRVMNHPVQAPTQATYPASPRSARSSGR